MSAAVVQTARWTTVFKGARRRHRIITPSAEDHAHRPIAAPGHSLRGLEFFAPSRNGRRYQRRRRRRGRAAVDVRSSGLLLLVDDRPSSRFECPQREIVSLSLTRSLDLSTQLLEIQFVFFLRIALSAINLIGTGRISVYAAVVSFLHEGSYRQSTRVKQCSGYGFSGKTPSYPVGFFLVRTYT